MYKLSSHTIRYIIIFSFILIMAGGLFIFNTMNSSLLKKQYQLFETSSHLKINVFREYLNSVTNNLRVYSQLPSFKSMRFYTLTLNKLAVEENKRQLELFFYDVLQNNSFIKEVRFIDNEGNEIIHVDNKTISRQLRHINFYPNVTKVLDKNLSSGRHYIELFSDNKQVLWWFPVYVSSAKRMGYLAFNINVDDLQKEVDKLSERNLNVVSISDSQGIIIEADETFLSKTMDTSQADKTWLISEQLDLDGANWSISVIGNTNSYTRATSLLSDTVYYGFFPLTLLILLCLIYLLHKNIQSERKIHQLAYYDSLTGLVSRHHFEIKLREFIKYYQRFPHDQAGLLLLDLDFFKPVNDTYGHAVGDLLLKSVAKKLLTHTRESDTVARIGGDEFAIIIQQITNKKDISIIVNKLIDTLSKPQQLEDHTIQIGCSIGITLLNQTLNIDMETYLKQADDALYLAKNSGRNNCKFFKAE